MLILTEKPSVAAAFAAALGVPKKQGFWENDDYCIVNALGHLLENYNPEDYNPALKKWSLASLPFIPDRIKFRPVAKTEAQLAVVKKCFDRRGGEPFLLATDAEREGELIGAEILDYAGFRAHASARRFWVSAALTGDVILDGIKNAKPLSGYASYRDQGYARQEADWLAGMNITRLLSLMAGKTLHFGRVQTAVLAAVHERETRIKNFIPEKYIEVAAVLGTAPPLPLRLRNPQNPEFPFRFPPGDPLPARLGAEKETLASAAVTDVQKDKKTVPPPRLFNLTALQKEASKKFSYSPEQTLSFAQALYEKHRCLSYPRTPSTVMGDENVDLVKGVYSRLRETYPEISAGSDPALVAADNKRIFNSKELEDHHALIPLTPLPTDASQEETNIFGLVLKRFFTAFMPGYVYNAVAVTANLKDFVFSGNAVEVLQPGWKEREKEDDGEEEKETDEADEAAFDPGIKAGNGYPVSSLSAAEKLTGPKKHFTFASILQLMENPRGDDGRHLAGLGTPATRGSILKKLFDRGYLLLKGKNITVSDDGAFLVENVKKNETLAAFVSVPETTRWEEELRRDTAKFLEGVRDFVRAAVAGVSVDAYHSERKSFGKCPLCGGDVLDGKRNFYCAGYKEGCRFVIWKEICGAAVSPKDAAALLAGKNSGPKKCKSKAGRDFQARFRLKDGKVELLFEDGKK
jgi:DNA topoisomerase-3